MVERLIGPVWGHRLLFLFLAGALMFLRLLPLPAEAGRLPGPDLLMPFLYAWTIRRPEYLPIWLSALVLLTEDLLLGRPPGLWAALVIGGSEFLRARVPLTRELSFGFEWFGVAAVMASVFALNSLIGNLALIPLPPIGFAIVQMAATMIVYPVAVAASWALFGLRKPSQGEIDERGRRL